MIKKNFKIIKNITVYLVIFSLVFSGMPSVLVAGDINTGLASDAGVALPGQTVIGLGQHQANEADYTKLQNAYQYIFKKTSNYNSDFLLYPENFTYNNDTTNVDFADGAILKIKDEVMPSADADIFNYAKASSTATIGRARALYDGHIAVLDLSMVINGQNRHLTYEADAYCHILHTYLGKHEQCFHGYADYQEYLADPQFPSKEASSIVMLNAADVQANRLLSGSDPFFKMLILPDLTMGMEEEILTELGSVGVNAIKNYVSHGGVIISSGKSSWLLEQIGLLASGTIDKNIVIKNQGNKGKLNFNNQGDFDSHLLKMGLLPNDDNNFDTYFLSSFYIKDGVDADLIPVANLDFSDTNYYFRNSMAQAIAAPEVGGLALAWKKYEQGRIYLFAGQPAGGTDKYYPYIFNAVFGALAKDVIPTLKVTQKTNPNIAETIIPGLEKNVILDGSLKIVNYFNQAIDNVHSVIYIPKGYSLEKQELLPNFCTVTALSGNATYDNKLDCLEPQIAAFASSTIDFELKITDSSITQKKYGILAASAQIAYVRTSGETEKINVGGAYLTAYRGAEIRSEYNPDPSAFYPLKGEGVYIDNVLTAENKEDTNANEVEHIAVVPLVSPVVDGSNQASLSYTLEFYNDYYQSRKASGTFIFPFNDYTEGNRDYDYLDYKDLKCTDVVLSPDWDTPVKTVLLSRAETSLPAASVCNDKNINQIIGKDYAYAINNESLVAKQLFFADAADYYQQATQRQLVYVDTSKEAGAASFYGGNIPIELSKGLVAKKNLIFARNDVYFYPNKNYVLPQGISDVNSYLTIDRYQDSACGDADGILEEGYYDDTLPDGIKANKYDNALQCKYGKTKIDLAQIEDQTGGEIKVSHYLFPIADDDNIDNVGDLAHFDIASGTYENYPEVKFVKAQTVDFLLNQTITPKGGRFVFSMPAGVEFNEDPIINSLITFSADHIAIRHIAYASSTREITVDFIRGKMPDETNGKPDVLRLNLENLNTSASVTLGAQLFSLNYDLGSSDDIAVYDPVTFDASLTLTQKPFLHLPSLIMKFRLKRGVNLTESYFQKYEYFEPFVRYGVYIQELAEHRTVYGYSENHPVSDPGLVLASGGFSTFSNIGASSIPFREYLQTGIKQVIPSSPETARVDYQDIWKRQWSTPIRTVMPDVPPIPPPLRNFMMNTTFEMRDKASGTRQLEWDSDRSAEVLYKIKTLNNYPKYFELTVCKNNELLVNANQVSNLYDKYFVAPDLANLYSGTNSIDNLYLQRGNLATYGVCYQSEGDKASNQVLDEAQRTLIQQAQTCENENNCPDMSGIPTVSKRPSGESGDWNYSQAVEDYFPENYTNESMWSLTHYDYADDAFSKGYMYHLDNVLPNLDNVRKDLLRPQNIIAQPIYKGLGYSLSYDPNYQSDYFSVEGENIIGWRSDNLQNKDDTLLGGQAIGNIISVDKNSAMTDHFININDLDQADPYVDKANKNIYACLFNPWRAEVDPANPNIVYPNNVYVNNVVPILPDLSKNDSRLSNYNCTGLNYSPETIHEVDNVVETDAKDWLYFGVGLRGGAKETINIVSQLNPISGVAYEGFAKINDGGRFTYWNPANGPNSFLVLDNVVNVVEAIQSNLTLYKEIIPVEVPTFNADIYHLITISDSNEYNREFTESPYLKHYGFGDAVSSVQVGVAENLNANGSILNPGETTAVKIELFNNSGYDWNLIKSADGEPAIEGVDLGFEALNANDLLGNLKHAVKQPTSFNFLDFAIPDEISPYIEISPSTGNIRTTGILFDFDNINVTSIRDGYKGSYTVNLKVKGDLPENLRGKTYDIGVSLVPKFFDRYPGHQNDPVVHDYNLTLPSLRFGIPYGDNKGALSGKVYRVNGYSHDISVVDEMPLGVEPMEIKKIDWAKLQSFRAVANNPAQRQQNLATLFDSADFGQSFTYSAELTASSTKRLNINFSDNGIDKFPIPQSNAPDINTVYLLVKSQSNYLPYGDSQVNKNLLSNYQDYASFGKVAKMSNPQYRIVRAAGADLQATYEAELIGLSSGEVLVTQKLSEQGDNYLRLNVRLENVGSAIAFRPKAKIYLPDNVELISGGSVETVGTSTVVTVSLQSEMAPGDYELVPIILKYNKNASLSWWNFFRIANAAEDQAEIVDHVEAEFDLTPTPGENNVNQETAGSFYMTVAEVLNPSLEITNSRIGDNKFQVSLNAQNITNPYFKFYQKIGDGNYSELGDDYSQASSVNLTVSRDGLYIYGAVYSRIIVINDQGEEIYQYNKEAESVTIFIGYNSSGGSVVVDSFNPPRRPIDANGNVLDFLIEVVDDAGKKINKTYEQMIKVKLDGGQDAVRMAISEFANFKNANMLDYQNTIDWVLSGDFGVKKLYAKFFTKHGIASDATSTEITLLDKMPSTEVIKKVATSTVSGKINLDQEASLLEKSANDLKALLISMGKKRNLRSEKFGMEKYIRTLNIKGLSKQQLYVLNNFIIYGTASSDKLTWNERFYLLQSYSVAFGKLPLSKADWKDLLLLANGQKPLKINVKLEQKMKSLFQSIFKKSPSTKDDYRVVDIMSYGLIGKTDNNQKLIKQAQAIFEKNQKRKVKNQSDWNVIKAIAYYNSFGG